MRKNPILIAMVTLLLILLVAIFLFSLKTEHVISEEPEYVLESSTFLKEYNLNKTTADKKYLNQTILVNGEVNSCTAITSGLNVELSAGSRLETVTCTLDYSQINNNINLNRGTMVSIKGRCGGLLTDEILGLKNISMVECSVIN